jgi:hypothetical protein
MTAIAVHPAFIRLSAASTKVVTFSTEPQDAPAGDIWILIPTG